MQRDAVTSLVRNPATPVFANHFHSIEDHNLIVQPHLSLTPKQQAALSKLLVFDPDLILAWLTILRSIEPGFRYRAGQGCPSNQQLDALSTLTDCGDTEILAWFARSHLPSR